MKHLLISILLIFPIAILSQPKKYYFDFISGNDANLASQAQNPATPWKTIGKFNSMFTSFNGGDSILFHRGQTFPNVAGGMAITKSGVTGTPINIGAYSTGANPIIDGSYTVPTWTSIGNGAYTATIPAGLATMGIVTMDGVFQPMGKLPKGNTGYYNVTTVGTNQVTGTNTNNGSLNFQAQGFATSQFVGGEIVWRPNRFVLWRGTINTQTATTITYTPFVATSGGPTENPVVNFGFFIQNHPAILTTALGANVGEWAYNGTTHVLTVYFGAAGPTGHTVKVSAVDNIINGGGDISNINFSNIAFQYGNRYMVSLGGAQNWTFNSCSFTYGGVYGINANNSSVGTNNLRVNNCRFDRINSIGVLYGSQATGGAWTNDTLTNIAAVAGMGGSGEGQYFAIRDIRSGSVTNCRITNTGYMPLTFQGTNNLIQNNFVDSFCTVKDDGGGIYCGFAAFTGSQVIGNIVLHGIGQPIGTPNTDFLAEGIYADNATTGVTYLNNTVAFCGDAGFFNHFASSLTFRGNTFYDCHVASIEYYNSGTPSTTNIYYANNINFAKIASELVYRSSGGTNSPTTFFSTLDSNYYCRPILETNPFLTLVPSVTNYTLPAWKTFIGKDVHSVVTPWSITDTSQLLFFYNNTFAAKTFNFSGITALDVKNVSYNSSVTLQPFTSIILKKNTTNPPLTISATATAIACFGGTSTITATATGGTSPYTYQLDGGTFQSSGTFSGVAAGTHTIVVKDNTGATAQTSVTITSPSQITISETNTAITINGNSSTVTVSANGGTGALTYSMDGGTFQTSNTFSVLAGNHIVTVRDANNCSNNLSFTITQPTALVISASASPNPVVCFSQTATITVTASGATPPYQYSLDAITFQASNQFTGKTAGTYTITVKDAAGATKTTSVTITQPTQITITESNPPINVNGGTTTVTLTATGGSGTSYLYRLNGGTQQTSPTFTGVVAGTYTAQVTDGAGCSNALTFTITQPSVLVVSAAATVNPLVCFGNTTTITVTASGGTTPYTYQINGGTSQSSNLFTNKGAGTYTLTVTDGAGVMQSTTVTITQPTQITISESHTTISVNGGTSTLTVTASGGTGSLTYSINGTSFQSSNVFNNVAAGTYTITVKDASACTNTLTTTITQPTALVVSAAVSTPIPCNNSTGSVTVTASGATPPYQYKVGSGSLQSSNIFSGLVAGTYTFTVQDAGGAIASTSLTVTQPAQITVGTTVSGSAPATVTVTASGGVPAFTYKLDGGSFQSSNQFTGVAAGSHTITVKDANGCMQTTTFTVGSPLGITLTYSAIVCNGGTTVVMVNATNGIPPYSGTGNYTRGAGTWTFTVSDVTNATHDTTITITQPALIAVSESNTTITTNGGTCIVTITASGGTGTFTYSLDGGVFQSSNQFAGVLAGNHSVIVKDGNTCTSSLAFSISQPGVLGISISRGAAITCFGGGQTITVTGSGGTTPYTYGKNSVFGSSNVFTNTLAGTYTFSVKDAFNARKDTIITVTQPTQITISVAYSPILVNGNTTTVTVTASGGTGGLTYSLDGGVYQGSNSFAGVAAGPHTIAVKDANGCINSFPFSITQPTALSISSVSYSALTCYGGTTTVTLTGTGGTTPYQYGKNGVFQTSAAFSSISAGTYTFSVRDTFGARKDSIVTVTQPSQIVITVTTGTISVNGGTTTVTASASGGTGGLTYSLDGGAYQGSGSFSGVSAGLHYVTVKDDNNCTNVNNFSITQPGVLVIGVSVATNPLACYGDATNVTVTSTGGTPPISGTGTFSQSAGTVTYTVTDQFGAVADTIITITQASQITVTQINLGTIATYGGTSAVTITVAGGTPVPTDLYYFQIDGGGYVLGSNPNTFTWSNVAGGNHTVLIKDANNCVITYLFNMPQPPRKGKKPINHIYVNG